MNAEQFQSLSDAELEQVAGGDGLFEDVLGTIGSAAGGLLDHSIEAVIKVPGTLIDTIGTGFGFVGEGFKGFGNFLKGINILPKLG